jgi:peptidoglycan/LPS O-acetylase OafA/YrhL
VSPAASHDNTFDEIRLVAALLVIWGHGLVLTGQAAPRLLGDSVQSIGVKIFFVVSGYLVALSWQRDPDPWRYLARRSLRIFPALIVCVLLTALVLGPLYTTLSWSDYVSNPFFKAYFRNIWLEPFFELPGVFQGLPYPRAVNGSLWTLPVEFAAYLLLPLLALSKNVRMIGTGLALALIAFWIGFDLWAQTWPSESHAPWVAHGTNWIFAAERMSYFWIGTLFALYRLEDRVTWVPLIIGVAVVALWRPEGTVAQSVALMALLPYACLFVAFRVKRTFGLRWITRRGDYSYGLYLYAFPVQQALLASLGVEALSNIWIDVILVTAITWVLAWASWHGVERTALKMKPRRKTASVPREREVT